MVGENVLKERAWDFINMINGTDDSCFKGNNVWLCSRYIRFLDKWKVS